MDKICRGSGRIKWDGERKNEKEGILKLHTHSTSVYIMELPKRVLAWVNGEARIKDAKTMTIRSTTPSLRSLLVTLSKS